MDGLGIHGGLSSLFGCVPSNSRLHLFRNVGGDSNFGSYRLID